MKLRLTSVESRVKRSILVFLMRGGQGYFHFVSFVLIHLAESPLFVLAILKISRMNIRTVGNSRPGRLRHFFQPRNKNFKTANILAVGNQETTRGVFLTLLVKSKCIRKFAPASVGGIDG